MFPVLNWSPVLNPGHPASLYSPTSVQFSIWLFSLLIDGPSINRLNWTFKTLKGHVWGPYLPYRGLLRPPNKTIAHNSLCVWATTTLIANKVWAQGHCNTQEYSWTLLSAQLERIGFKIYLQRAFLSSKLPGTKMVWSKWIPCVSLLKLKLWCILAPSTLLMPKERDHPAVESVIFHLAFTLACWFPWLHPWLEVWPHGTWLSSLC